MEKLLKKLRADKKLNQAQLGRLIGKSNQTICNIETGRYVPAIQTLDDIFSALSIEKPIQRKISAYFKKKRENNLHKKSTDGVQPTRKNKLAQGKD